MIARWLILAAVLSCAGTASAGDRATSYALHCGMKAADLGSTELVFRNNSAGYETNNTFGMQSMAGRAAWGAGTCIAAGEVDHRMRKHRKLRWAFRGIALGMLGYAVQQNARVAQRGR